MFATVALAAAGTSFGTSSQGELQDGRELVLTIRHLYWCSLVVLGIRILTFDEFKQRKLVASLRDSNGASSGLGVETGAWSYARALVSFHVACQ